MNIVKFSLLYFSLVFGAGFILGTLRVLLIEPQFGARVAELLELPVMLLVIFYSARFVVVKSRLLIPKRHYLYLGLLALFYLLFVEFALVLGLRDMSLQQYFVSRDPVSGSAYVLSLVIYMLMPWLFTNRKR